MSCGVLNIKTVGVSDLSPYQFGISLTPIVTTFQDSPQFVGLQTGVYNWVVIDRNTKKVLQTGISNVKCNDSVTFDLIKINVSQNLTSGVDGNTFVTDEKKIILDKTAYDITKTVKVQMASLNGASIIGIASNETTLPTGIGNTEDSDFIFYSQLGTILFKDFIDFLPSNNFFQIQFNYL